MYDVDTYGSFHHWFPHTCESTVAESQVWRQSTSLAAASPSSSAQMSTSVSVMRAPSPSRSAAGHVKSEYV